MVLRLVTGKRTGGPSQVAKANQAKAPVRPSQVRKGWKGRQGRFQVEGFKLKASGWRFQVEGFRVKVSRKGFWKLDEPLGPFGFEAACVMFSRRDFMVFSSLCRLQRRAVHWRVASRVMRRCRVGSPNGALPGKRTIPLSTFQFFPKGWGHAELIFDCPFQQHSLFCLLMDGHAHTVQSEVLHVRHRTFGWAVYSASVWLRGHQRHDKDTDR